MIFSNKIYRIQKGTNISLYAGSENTLSLFIYNDVLSEFLIELNQNKTIKHIRNYEYQKLVKLNQNHTCVCYDNSMSIIENE